MADPEVVPPAGYKALQTRDWDIPQGAGTVNALRYGTKTGDDDTVYPDLTTGWSARAQIRDTPGGTVWATLLSSSLTGPRIVLEADGFFTLILPAEATQGDDWNGYAAIGQGVYDVELVPDGGEPIRHTEGTVFVYPDVTRTEVAS
jgi:hypothetical protein